MTHQPLIEVNQITRTDPANQRDLLKPASLTLRDGDRIGLRGPSGSGKSTLLRAIAYLDPVQSGTIKFQGQPLLSDKIPKYRRTVAYLPQRSVAFAGSVKDNLQVAFDLGVSKTQRNESQLKESQRLESQAIESQAIESQAIAHLADFGRTADFLDQSASSLSGGELQIIAFIRCLLTQPMIILFDEPTTSLDSVAQSQFEQEVESWFAVRHNPLKNPEQSPEPRAFIWSSHDTSQLERLTDQVITMHEGTLVVGRTLEDESSLEHESRSEHEDPSSQELTP